MFLNCSNYTAAIDGCANVTATTCSFSPTIFHIGEYCICLLGMVGNLLVTLAVWRKHSLHNIVFEAIAALAVADFVFLLVLTLRVTLMALLSCENVAKFIAAYNSILSGMLFTTMFATNCHVSAISVLRYVMLAHPLQAITWITTRVLQRTSIGIWVGGVLVGSIYIIYTTVIANPVEINKNSVVYYVSVWAFINFLPLLVTATFHIAKMRAIRTHTQNSWRSELMVRMSRIVTIIIITSAVLPMPLFVLAILFVSRVINQISYYYWSPAGGLIVICGNTINPIIYSFMSVDFRKAIFGRHAESRHSVNQTEPGNCNMSIICQN